MSQDVFCSVYSKDFKWWENVERPPSERGINIAEDPEKYDKFLSPQELKPGKESVDAIKHLRQLRNKSTYRVDYCEERFSRSDASLDPLKEDELMDSLERVLYPPSRKLLPPPDTARVVYGYCPLRRFGSSRTVYTDVISRPAYEQLKRLVLERGACRLATPPIVYPETDHSTPPCRQGKELPPRTWIHLQPAKK